MPSHLETAIEVGSVVRVPLGGRRTRGYVVELSGPRPDRLKEVAAVSGELPAFDSRLLESLRWASLHYVAPIAVLLERAAPPNLPRRAPPEPLPSARPQGRHPIRELAEASVREGRRPARVLIGPWQDLEWLQHLGVVAEAGRSALLVLPTEAEARNAADAAAEEGLPVVVAAGDDDRELTDAWSRAQHPGRVVVGTPRAAAWRVAGLSLAVVVEEGRRAMKDRQTPTLHVRELLSTRSRIEGFTLVFFGPTPSLEALAAGPSVTRLPGRPWPLVEVVDRSEEPPGSGLLAERTVAALRAVVDRGGRALLFSHRRAADASLRCTSCRRVRLCASCGSRLARDRWCRRCGRGAGPCAWCGGSSFEAMGSQPEQVAAEANRRLGARPAAPHPASTPILAGTERDLVEIGPQHLVVAVDVDGLALGHDYRAGEEGLRVLARAANALGRGRGRRLMAQTSMPDAPLLQTLRRGDPLPYLTSLLEERAALGLPPASEMIAIEVRGELEVERVDAEIRSLPGATVLGPAETGGAGRRWLLQGRLGTLRRPIRPLVQRWRDSGLTVRIDADPIDL